jgi:hypothetical protein
MARIFMIELEVNIITHVRNRNLNPPVKFSSIQPPTHVTWKWRGARLCGSSGSNVTYLY